MKNRFIKVLSFVLAGALAFALLPLSAGALPPTLKLNSKELSPIDGDIRTPQELENGEVYTYTTATGTSVTGAQLPWTDFNIGLSAIGQKYQITTSTTIKYNIVFVLDVSNSRTQTTAWAIWWMRQRRHRQAVRRGN
jgi:hypothetical protein